jgi:hypothetical protein
MNYLKIAGVIPLCALMAMTDAPRPPVVSDAIACRPLSTSQLAAANLGNARSTSPIVPPLTGPQGGTVPTFKQIMEAFCAFDINGDGTAEINSLTSMMKNPDPYESRPNGVIIVFVDPRLISKDPNIRTPGLAVQLMLGLLGGDLYREGYYPYFVTANVYSGSRHQDGRTLLAMRRFLQQIRRFYPLSGTLLVGSFPDATIVRTVLVRDAGNVDSPKDFTSGNEPRYGYTGPYLAVGSESVTTRAEIVLGDLDGNWEGLYREKLKTIDYRFVPNASPANFPFENETETTGSYTRTEQCFDDAFHIVDHNVTIKDAPPVFQTALAREASTNVLQTEPTRDSSSLLLPVDVTCSNLPSTMAPNALTFSLNNLVEPSPEATVSDRQQPNRIARPEIVVGRINPKSIAVNPDAPIDSLGNGPLNASGVPQRLVYNWWQELKWKRDPDLERRLVIDYLARAHKFRLGSDRNTPKRVSSIRGPDSNLMSPASFNTILRGAFPGLGPVVATQFDNATSVDFVTWLKQPAALRGIAAHSDRVNSQFTQFSSARDLEVATGANAFGEGVWRWVRSVAGSANTTLTPSFETMKVDINFHFFRTLWENKVLAGSAQMFIVHDGCEVMRPANSEILPYNSLLYGQEKDTGGMANGESLMFYANGLGLMARNKVFNDTPDGFSQAIKASGGRFGYGWVGYFQKDAANVGLDERTANPTSPDRRTRTLQRKRSYFWNTIGDPTLKLRY